MDMDGTRLLDPRPAPRAQRPRPRPRRFGRLTVWLRRYAPAELAATIGAIASAAAADPLGIPAATAYAATIGEGIAFYAVLLVRDVRARTRTADAGSRPSRARTVAHATRGLALEFGPAELLDTLLVRPAAMLAGPLILGSVTAGVLVGKVAADLVFYAIAIVCLETSRHLADRRASNHVR
jgi:hypothetical protein